MVTRFDLETALMKALSIEGRQVVSVKIESAASANPLVTLVFEPSDAELQSIADAVGAHREVVRLDVLTAPVTLPTGPVS